MNSGYGCSEEHLTHYTCRRAVRPPRLDGRLDDPVWQAAQKSPWFVDLVTGVPGFLKTSMATLWDEDHLYVGYWVEEPNVQACLTERDPVAEPGASRPGPSPSPNGRRRLADGFFPV